MGRTKAVGFASALTEAEPTEEVSDVNWEDYVMSQFRPDELVDGKYPTVNGLRRVCEVVLGPITEGAVHVVQGPTNENQVAIVEYAVTIRCVNEPAEHRVRRFSSAADAHYGNTDNMYRQYLTAIAETRAEARALRKALKIRIVAADEISEVAQLDKENATDVQKTAIASIIRRKGLDVSQIAKENNFELVNGQLQLTSDEAKRLIQKLQSK